MKKIFTTLAAAMSALALMATTYTGQLTVTVNGVATVLNDVAIQVDQVDNSYTLSINNFKLNAATGVGNIVLDQLTGSTTSGITMLGVNRNITISEGDEAGVGSWLGPELGLVPISMIATISGNILVTDIDIDMMASLQQIINVHFTSDTDKAFRKQFQIGNSDFESWKASSGEPDHWHGFKSASGDYASSASSKLYSSTDTHTGTGKSAVVQSDVIFGIVANGTMTNGQLNAGAMTADNPANHSHMDINSEEVDNNKDPFYTALLAAPDAMNLWVKFTQENGPADYPYATVSAIVFDGNYYQDPEDKTYTNVAAKAKNNTIATGGWRELSIPFDYNSYASNNAAANAILVTMSTNATPGKGSKKSGLFGAQKYDYLWIDDVELVYNATIENIALSGLSLNGFTFNKNTKNYNFTYEGELNISAANFAVTTSGRSAISAVIVNELDGGNYEIAICATSPDMVNNDLYTINITKITPLADIVASGVNEIPYAMKEEAKVAHLNINEETFEVWALLTDGNGNWMKAEMPFSIAMGLFSDEAALGATAYDAASVRGILSNINTNPLLTLTSVPTPLYGEPFNDFATHNLANALSIKPNEMAKFVGYIDNDGKLRGYNTVEWGVPGGQSLDIDNQSGVELTAGKQYSIKGIVSVKEAWSNAAPRRIATTDDNFFDNFTVAALEAEELLPTAVTDIDAASQVKSVRYYDAMGRVHNAPVDGINIVVTEMANGTTTTVKVVR